MPHSSKPPHDRKAFGLSINGGGTHFYASLVFLSTLQKQLRAPLHEYIDIFCGVSGGAIPIGLFVPDPKTLNKPLYTPQDYLNITPPLAKNIFKEPDTTYGKFLRTLKEIEGGPIYNREDIRRIMKHQFHDLTLDDTLVGVLLPVIDMETNKLSFFKSKKLTEKLGSSYHNFYLYDAVSSGCWAEYFFDSGDVFTIPSNDHIPPVKYCVGDAGMRHNNPSDLLLSDLAQLTHKTDIKPVIISVGFHESIDYKSAETSHVIQKLQHIFRVGIDGPGDSVRKKLQRQEKLGNINFFNYILSVPIQEFNDNGLTGDMTEATDNKFQFAAQKMDTFLKQSNNQESLKTLVKMMEQERMYRLFDQQKTTYHKDHTAYITHPVFHKKSDSPNASGSKLNVA